MRFARSFLPKWIARSLLIARVESVRGVRGVLTQKRKIVAWALFAVFFVVPVVFGGTFFAYFYGDRLAGGSFDIPQSIRGGVVGGWLIIVFLTSVRTVNDTGELENIDGLLTTVGPREVVAGSLISEFGGVVGILSLPFVPPLLALTFSTGSPVILLIPFLLLPFFGSSLAFGYSLGMVIRIAVTQFEWIARRKIYIGAFVTAAYFGFLITGLVDTVSRPIISFLGGSPLGLYADVLAVVIPGLNSDSISALVALAGVTLLVPVFFVSAWLLASYHWYSDKAQTGEEERESNGFSSGVLSSVTSVLGPKESIFSLSKPTRVVALKTWLRAKRSPIKLTYVIYPLFGLYQPISETIETGQVSSSLAVLITVYIAWSIGAAFTLNPLGDEGSHLPATLTTPITGASFVGGRVLAALVVGIPFSVTVTVLLGTASPLSSFEGVITILLGVSLVVVATLIASGVGTLFPNFNSMRVARNTRAVIPSLTAFGAYSFILLIVSLPGVVGVLGADFISETGVVSVPLPLLTLSGFILTLFLSAVFGIFSLYYAINTFEGYTIETQ